MIRSGRIRSELMTKSRMVIWPVFPNPASRVSIRTTCGCSRLSSAASSKVITLSFSDIYIDNALSNVVLPEPVPPEIITLTRQLAAIMRKLAISLLMAPISTKSSNFRLLLLNFRIESTVPSNAIGLIATLIRLPSIKRASASGRPSSIRRLARCIKRLAISVNCSLLIKRREVKVIIPKRSINIFSGPLTIISLIESSSISSLNGPNPVISSAIMVIIFFWSWVVSL
ncbi:Uncharacterised protein [Yersinia enterocolitica]|nr:Uncharacterised protein [Yersinia enterocolitica]